MQAGRGHGKAQRGAALPLGIALLLCGAVGGFVLYNTGQSATDKARVVNAADAASYSGLVWQARALNFQAYTNRAMVANQVSIGQAVSLRSWAAYGAITAVNVELVLGKVPYIGPIFVGAARAMEGVERVAAPVANAILNVVDTVNVGIGHAQNAMFVSSFAATPEIIGAVAEANDPRFTVDTAFSVVGIAGNLGDWKAFTDRVDVNDTDAMLERARIIGGDPDSKDEAVRLGQRDHFTAKRNWELLPFDLPVGIMKFNVDREGETRLVHRRDADGNLLFEWKAKDTVSLDVATLDFSIKKGFHYDHVDLPIGWAEAYANSVARASGRGKGVGAGKGGKTGGYAKAGNGAKTGRRPGARGAGGRDGNKTIEEGACTRTSDFFRSPLSRGRDCKLWLANNHNAERLADAGEVFAPGVGEPLESRIPMEGYSGLNPFRTLSPKTIEAEFPTMRLKVEVALDADEVRSSEALGTAGRFRTGYRAPGHVLSSVSVAEVFFKPPMADRDEGKIEFANAYNPWWDVRLAPVSETDRMAAFAARDHGDTAFGAARAPGAGGDDAHGLAEWDGTSSIVATAGTVLAAAGELAEATGALDEMKDQVRDAVGNAAERLLAEALGGARADVQRWAEERIGVDIDATEAAADAALAEAKGVRAEAERVQDLLRGEFRETVERRLEEAFGGESDLFAALQDPNAPETLVEAARERLDEIEDRLVRELGRELHERVEAMTDVFEMPQDMARHQVRLFLKAIREGVTGVPDLIPLGSDSLLDAGEGPDPDAPADPDGTDPDASADAGESP